MNSMAQHTHGPCSVVRMGHLGQSLGSCSLHGTPLTWPVAMLFTSGGSDLNAGALDLHHERDLSSRASHGTL